MERLRDLVFCLRVIQIDRKERIRAARIHQAEWPRFAREVAWAEADLAGFTRKEKVAANAIYEKLYGPLWGRWDGQTDQALAEYVDFITLQIRIARSHREHVRRSNEENRPG